MRTEAFANAVENVVQTLRLDYIWFACIVTCKLNISLFWILVKRMNTQMIELRQAYDMVSAHPNFRILRKLTPLRGADKANGPVGRIAFLDTETTGLDPRSDVAIDLGVIVLEVETETGRFVRVLDTYEGLQDPGFPIPENIVALTGITDDMVRGQRFDLARINDLCAGVDLVIAHKADHDRPFAEVISPVFKNLPWACSLTEVDWRGNGYASSALEFLALKAGYFYDAHRALVDTHALSRVAVETKLPISGETALQTLIRASLQSTCQVYATNASFDKKDVLRANGYRWDGEDRVWSKSGITEDQLDEELQWLREAVYDNRPARVQVSFRDATERYSLSASAAEVQWRSLGAQGDGSGHSARASAGGRLY